ALRAPAVRRPPGALRAGGERARHLGSRARHRPRGARPDRTVTAMPAAPLTVLGFGFVLGLRHALDVDHLAAVSTIVSQRRSLWRSSLVGALWGLGHIPSPALALAYVVIFGAGSIGGMVAMSTLFGVPLALAGGRFARAELGIRLGAALGSLAVGLRLAWQLGTGA